jgi:glycosyltransferase involved in cell wall biosynthesis
MRVCHITTVHKAYDGRIFHKECKSLVKGGHDVFLVAPDAEDHTVNGVKMIGIRRISNPYKRILFAPIIAFSKALRTRAQVFHLHDPELLPAGFFLSLIGKKVIFDSHEHVGEQILSKSWIPTKILRKLASLSYLFCEKLFTLFYAGIINADGTNNNFNHKKKVITINNYPILAYINDHIYQVVPKNSDIVLIYAGGLTRIRGIKEIVLSMKGIDARLWLLGPWESESYRKECEMIPSWSKCDYIGEVPFGRQYDYFRAADIGMATLYPEKNYLTSEPVKAYEYMACGLAIVMSNFAYWKKLYGDFAYFVDPFSPVDIALKVNKIIEEKDKFAKLREAGIEKVKNDFSWEQESKKLLAFYENI